MIALINDLVIMSETAQNLSIGLDQSINAAIIEERVVGVDFIDNPNFVKAPVATEVHKYKSDPSNTFDM